MGLPKTPAAPGHDAAALFAVVLLLFGPCSIFLYANFTESLFLLLLAAFLLCLQSRWWWRAALIAGIAASCRSQGVLFGPILALTYLLRSPVRGLPRKLAVAAALGALASTGLVAYMVFLQARFGDPLAFMHAQAHWNVGLGGKQLLYAANPLNALTVIWHRATGGPVDWPRLWEALCVVWPPVLLIAGRKRLSFELALLGWILWALPYVSNSLSGFEGITGQWMSMGRFMAVLVPGYLIVADSLSRHPRAAPFVLIPWVAAFGVFAYLYGNGAWIG
jgi:hypothetical protein